MTPLLTADVFGWTARSVRWRRGRALLVVAAAIAVVSLHVVFDPPVECRDAAPCGPDPLNAVLFGLVAALPVVAFVSLPVAAWLAAGFVTADALWQVAHPALASPAWLTGCDAALAVLAFVTARLAPPGLGSGAQMWAVTTSHRAPPRPRRLPRYGLGWRLLAVPLLLSALAIAIGAVAAQSRADDRLGSAERVVAEVVGQPDEYTIEVRLPSATDPVRVTVADASEHPVGANLAVLVADGGLYQLVSEPYDTSGWLSLAVLLAGLALGCLARARERAAAARALFDGEQPATEVYVWALGGRVAVYATDARPGEPALVEFFALSRHGSDDIRPGVLFGVPAQREWCAVAVDGELLVPRGPARSGRFAPAYGGPAPDPASPSDFEVPDAARLPLRPEEILALRTEDVAATPEIVHTHRHNRFSGYAVIVAASWPFLIVLSRLLPALPYWGAVALAAPVTAIACVSGWRLFLRPRVSWNGAGLSVVGSIGARLLVWSEVHAIRADRHGAVTIETDQHGAGLVVTARGEQSLLPRFLSGDERTGAQLSGALRLTSERAAARDRDRVRDVVSLPPAPVPPPAPVLLYAAWLAEALLYALVLTGYFG
ncbi:PH domain-containing protein [Dactylosporangium sp. CA-233914]|uniref:PH domain-containing protein n=1 Tax=Dactylosporangium sp. CA-233914 TaxID=3239934 RepID=UPI003D9353AB